MTDAGGRRGGRVSIIANWVMPKLQVTGARLRDGRARLFVLHFAVREYPKAR